MKILVLGSLEHARALLRQRSGRARMIYHCGKPVEVTRSFSPIDPPDWIFIEGEAISTEGIALIQSLHTMDFSSPTEYPPADAQDAGHRLCCPARSCGIEQDGRGGMRLRCSLHQATYRNTACSQHAARQTEAALCFEYQAPPRRSHN